MKSSGKKVNVSAEIKWPGEFPKIESKRLLLRSVSSDDSSGIYRCFSNPETMKFLGTPLDEPELVEGIVTDYMDGFSQGCSLVWTLEEKSTGNFQGTAGFEEFNFLDCSAELGFTLLQESTGNGFMTEALGAILDFGFSWMGINRIHAGVLPENTPAVNLLQRLNFKVEGILKQSVFFRERFHHQMILALLKEEVEN